MQKNATHVFMFLSLGIFSLNAASKSWLSFILEDQQAGDEQVVIVPDGSFSTLRKPIADRIRVDAPSDQELKKMLASSSRAKRQAARAQLQEGIDNNNLTPLQKALALKYADALHIPTEGRADIAHSIIDDMKDKHRAATSGLVQEDESIIAVEELSNKMAQHAGAHCLVASALIVPATLLPQTWIAGAALCGIGYNAISTVQLLIESTGLDAALDEIKQLTARK